MFDAAGLAYPNHDYSDAAWTQEALRDLAMELTLDANGNNAKSPGPALTAALAALLHNHHATRSIEHE